MSLSIFHTSFIPFKLLGINRFCRNKQCGEFFFCFLIWTEYSLPRKPVISTCPLTCWCLWGHCSFFMYCFCLSEYNLGGLFFSFVIPVRFHNANGSVFHRARCRIKLHSSQTSANICFMWFKLCTPRKMQGSRFSVNLAFLGKSIQSSWFIACESFWSSRGIFFPFPLGVKTQFHS